MEPAHLGTMLDAATFSLSSGKMLGSFSQPRNHSLHLKWELGLVDLGYCSILTRDLNFRIVVSLDWIILCVEGVLSIVGHLSASMAFAHFQPLPVSGNYKNCLQTLLDVPCGTQSPPIERHCFRLKNKTLPFSSEFCGYYKAELSDSCMLCMGTQKRQW